MRISILAILIAVTSTAQAGVTWQSHDEFGVDLAVLHTPGSDETAAGPVFHLNTATSRAPSWLMFGFQIGMFTGNADRILAPLFGNVRIGDREGPFARLDGGWILASQIGDDDEDQDTWSVAYGATVGWKVGAWQLSASALKGDAFIGPAWMFTLGRDVAHLDAVVTRTAP
jgi:hypothetical protein